MITLQEARLALANEFAELVKLEQSVVCRQSKN